MAGSYLTINDITNVNLESVEHGIARLTGQIEIPGGTSQRYTRGIDLPMLTLKCEIVETTQAAGEKKFRQIVELVSNPDYGFVYIQFPDTETIHDGFYNLESIRFSRDGNLLGDYVFDLIVSKQGTLGEKYLATVWESGEEIISGWSSLTKTNMIALPYSVTNVAWAIAATRTSSDGSNQILENPTRQTISFNSSATIADWFKSDCRIYDSVVAGDTNEANWAQVFSSQHIFTGDQIVQNGLLRYKINAGTGKFWLWVASAWQQIGELKTALTGNLAASIKSVHVIRLTPEIVQWKEKRMNGTNPITLTFTLRRGALHCRVKLSTFSLGIDAGTYVQLNQAGAYAQFFNSQVTGASGAGNLNQDTALNYEAGYATANGWVAGFALCDQPVKQPYDIAGSGAIAESNTWGVGATRTFFVIAFPEATNPIVLATARADAAAVAKQCLKAVEQELDLISAADYV